MAKKDFHYPTFTDAYNRMYELDHKNPRSLTAAERAELATLNGAAGQIVERKNAEQKEKS